MDHYIQYLPTPPQLLRVGASALNEILLRLKAMGVDSPKSNAEFDIANETGYLPSYPLERLPPAFEFWERALSEAPDTLSLGEEETDEAISRRPGSELWRQRIREGPLIPTHTIEHDRRKLQRAHLVLAYLTHYYVHSTPPSGSSGPMVVPKTLAIPLVAVSRLLGIAPVLTYADTVLWNAYPINPDYPMAADNIRFQHLFSGTDDEDAFYRTSALVELRGAELLQIFEEYQRLPNVTDLTMISKVAGDLRRITGIVDELNDIVQSVRASCDPHVFYWEIRPWYRGADADGPTSPGWLYEGVSDSDSLDLSGPSAGQSTVFHALDVWMDIDHKLKQKRYPAPSEENKKADHSFMERMRRYMPGPHREHLRYLETSSRPIREIARQTPALREPYNAAVMAMKKFRDCHIRVACLYIVSMSKTTRNKCPMMAAMAGQQEIPKRAPIRGTGGNELSTLLKAGRDATKRAVLQ